MNKTYNLNGENITVSNEIYDKLFPPGDPQPAQPRSVSSEDFLASLTDAEAASVKLRDLLRISAVDRVPVTKGAVKRIADKIGTTPDALFDKIQGA